MLFIGLGDWVKDLFIDHAVLFLRILNWRWKAIKEEPELIANILRKHGVKKGKILDLMCGNGRIAIPLAKMGYMVTGIDICPLFIEDAKRKAEKYGVLNSTRFITGDIRKLNEILEEDSFDAALNVWTSLGYYSEKEDLQMFKMTNRLVKPGGLFLILNCASKELMLQRFARYIYEDFGDILVLHENSFDIKSSRLNAKWFFYERKGMNLKFLGETKLNLRLYSYHEVVKMLEEAGWEVVAMYHSIRTLEPATSNSPINIVAKKVTD